MSVFRWTAPLLKWASRRWSEDDFRAIGEWLRPHVAPGGIFADLGGGTGDLGAGVARALDARVIIVDATPQMLRRVDAHPLVTVRLASAERLPFPSSYLDAALCCDAFHHFRDQDAVAREVARVVRPGGGVVILDIDPAGSLRLVVGLERILREPAGFRSAADLEEFLAPRGITGRAGRHRGSSYAFVGSVGGSV